MNRRRKRVSENTLSYRSKTTIRDYNRTIAGRSPSNRTSSLSFWQDRSSRQRGRANGTDARKGFMGYDYPAGVPFFISFALLLSHFLIFPENVFSLSFLFSSLKCGYSP
ncbi:hypothetical protein TNCT_630441 [Trichonephila clavata]|uniref:Uncharacterized protein n=1 Tax=Trichonephila clavata TaxID=2740835 RepID=A0A8X6LXG7_TRICU|nr:hypothetical protein TNCT_630441 [Trichonephila clavata]